ncbi:MAG: hypothetical protein MJ102_05160 [Clostridia bacterium]|nr:hypothetical protein [Clostridia bacterium]
MGCKAFRGILESPVELLNCGKGFRTETMFMFIVSGYMNRAYYCREMEQFCRGNSGKLM